MGSQGAVGARGGEHGSKTAYFKLRLEPGAVGLDAICQCAPPRLPPGY